MDAIVTDAADASILTSWVSPVVRDDDAPAPRLPAGYVCTRGLCDADDLAAGAWVSLAPVFTDSGATS